MFDPDLPVRSDDDVLRFCQQVLDLDGGGPGGRERLTWVLLLDADERPLPTLIPIEGVPVDPDPEDVDRFAQTMRQITAAVDAALLIVLWERPGDADARMQEADWAAALAAAGLPLRAQVLATDDGLRLLDPAFEAIVAG